MYTKNLNKNTKCVLISWTDCLAVWNEKSKEYEIAEGAWDLLLALAYLKIPVVLVSSVDQDILDCAVEDAGMEDLFTSILGSTGDSYSDKPAEGAFWLALDCADVIDPTEGIVFIGTIDNLGFSDECGVDTIYISEKRGITLRRLANNLMEV